MKVTFPKAREVCGFFLLLGWEVNFKPFFFLRCNTEIKLETALSKKKKKKKRINTIIQQSEYAKEKNTRQLRARAGMQKWSYFKKEH